MEAVGRVPADLPVRVQGLAGAGSLASTSVEARRCCNFCVAREGSGSCLRTRWKPLQMKSEMRMVRDGLALSEVQRLVGGSIFSSADVQDGLHQDSTTNGRKLIQVQGIGARRLNYFRILAKVGETENTQDSADTTDDSKVVKGKGFGTPKPVVEKKKSSSSGPSSNSRRAPPQKPLIGAEGVDEESKQFETGFVTSLVFLFSLIIVEGVALAASGFLPEEWDEFLLKVIYPIFTPTVGVFLAGAAGYGVWKYFGYGEKKGPTNK